MCSKIGYGNVELQTGSNNIIGLKSGYRSWFCLDYIRACLMKTDQSRVL